MTGSTLPTYQKIKQQLLAEIRAGTFRPGDLLPSEEDLAARFACGRITAHRAVRELAEEGFVERRRKAGTRVTLAPARMAQIEIPIIEREVTATGATYRYALLKREITKPDPLARDRLSLAASDKALHLRCLHFANETPFQLEERWINLKAVPAAKDQLFEEEGPNPWLVRTVPFSDAEHVFLAANATVAEAGVLGIEARDALFVIERRTWREGRTITWVRLSYPGRYYRMRTRSNER